MLTGGIVSCAVAWWQCCPATARANALRDFRQLQRLGGYGWVRWLDGNVYARAPVELKMQHGPLSDARLRALAAEICDGTFGSETDWVEWKRELDFTTAEGRFPLPKNILGMANRVVEVAQRNCDGYGYILIGVEHGSTPGVTPVDVAQLEDWIAPYLGATGPSWQPRYLRVHGATILAVEVGPPRPGDSIRTLRREFDRFNAGTIFVRKNGKTERASPDDIANLEERSRGSRLELELGLVGPHEMSWFDDESVSEAMRRGTDRSRSTQLARARNFSTAGEPTSTLGKVEWLAATAMYGTDNRSLKEYCAAVERWHEKLSGVAMQHWLDSYMIAGHGVYVLQLQNLTDQNFADVEVRLWIEGVRVEDEIPEQAVELPQKPKPFGRGVGLLDVTNLSLDYPALGPILPYTYEPPELFAIERNDDDAEVVWIVGHLRPEASKQSDAFCIVVRAPRNAPHLTVHWSATSTSISGVVRSSHDIPLAARQTALDDIEHALPS